MILSCNNKNFQTQIKSPSRNTVLLKFSLKSYETTENKVYVTIFEYITH